MISSVSPSMVYQSNPLVSNLRANGLTPDKAILAATDVKGAIQQIGMVQRGPANKAAITAALQERISADVAAGNLTADDAAAVFKTFEEMDPARQVGGSGAKARAPRAEGDAPSLTKEQIDAQIAQIGAVDSQRLAMLKEISNHFTAADVNSDGKVSHDEAETYLRKAQDPSRRPQEGETPDGPPPAEGAGGPPPPGGAGGPPPKDGAGGPPPRGGGGGGGGGGQASSTKTVLSESTTVVGNLQTTTTLYTDGTTETKTEAVSADALSATYSKASVTDFLKSGATSNNGEAKAQAYLSSITPGSLFDFLVH
jgi:hypothetical protein